MLQHLSTDIWEASQCKNGTYADLFAVAAAFRGKGLTLPLLVSLPSSLCCYAPMPHHPPPGQIIGLFEVLIEEAAPIVGI